MNNGKFVISLDFELFWGVRDKRTIESYGENIKGVHSVIPRLLATFDKYNIKATFSIVGFLFFKTKKELLANIPSRKPEYVNPLYSPYTGYFDNVGENYEEDQYHFAPQLIQEIQKHPQQEIGSHTFSHYYCLENGQTMEDFKSDINKAIETARKYEINPTSLIFPRNQFNENYLKVCSDSGIICYRGNEHSWLYNAKNRDEESLLRRALRLVDSYINISGQNCHSDDYIKSKNPMDIPSSKFLRPVSKKLNMFERLRLRRIKSGMTYAAKHNLTYHLWWHPHNFGVNQNDNFNFLIKILEHYMFLNNEYNFKSITMSQLATNLINGK